MGFYYQNGELFCEKVPIKEIVKTTGTPVYIYSANHFEERFKAFDKAFENHPHLVCYSVKANSNVAILKLLAKLGAGADIVSGGELIRALKAGISPSKIVFSGVGKTEEEIELALKNKILMFNVESEEELFAIELIARKLNTKAPVSVRINPDVDPKTHPYISTGMKKNKFGISEKRAPEIYLKIKNSEFLEPVGIDVHIGSQITDLSPFEETFERIKNLVKMLNTMEISVRYLDLGGGLGICYKDETPPSPEEYVKKILEHLGDLDLTIIIEPGRAIAGNGGILVTKVLYIKTTETKKFVIVDGAMNDLIRPSLYDAYHEILPVEKKEGEKEKVDVVGPICESGDFFARERELPSLQKGDLLAVLSSGAYGYVMASNYNSRGRAPEVLVKNDKFYVIKRRETIFDLLSFETIPVDFL